MNEIDRAFLLPTKVMDFTSARARALNTNLAHASEPGYRRVDVDFGRLLEAARARPGRREQALAAAAPALEVDAATPAAADGNNVSFEHEQVQIDKNALLHELAAFVANSRLNTLRTAISGR